MNHIRAVAIESAAGPELWLCDLTRMPGVAECESLSDGERYRASQFHAVRDRRRYLAAHWALRCVIRNFAGIGTDRIVLDLGGQGKPSLVGHPMCHFNISYAGDRALIGVSGRAEIGVDIEMRRAVEYVDELAESSFSTSERHELAASRLDDERQQRFLQGWVRKEACLKAVGLGFALDPTSFTSGTGADRAMVAMPVSAGSSDLVVNMIAVGRDLVAAYAMTLN